jgi:serine/threonine protein kinase
LAMHLPTNEKVAVKLIEKKSMRPKDVVRVKSEIAILSSIRHRNILQLYEIIETEKSLLLITEYLERGELFRQIIKQKK